MEIKDVVKDRNYQIIGNSEFHHYGDVGQIVRVIRLNGDTTVDCRPIEPKKWNSLDASCEQTIDAADLQPLRGLRRPKVTQEI